MKSPKLLFAPKAIIHSVVVMSRIQRGRLHVLRDRPQWFVVGLCVLYRKTCGSNIEIADSSRRLLIEARMEIRSRYVSHIRRKYPLWPDTTVRMRDLLRTS
jgi:hypothetical protein